MGPLRTKKQAERYVAQLLEVTGKTHLIFKCPKGTMAHSMGYRFGTCEESEREAYERDGAVFVS